MRMNPFGRTGMEVSAYGLGTWAFGGGIYGTVDDSESIRTIHRAEEFGVNFIDTAPMYGMADAMDGRAERVVGRALQGRRDRWIVSTKYGRHLKSGEAGVEIREDFSPAQARKSLEESLRRLRMDYVDVFFVHTPTPDPEIFKPDEALTEMVRLKEEGKVRAVGFSFHETAGSWLPAIEPFLREGVCEAVQVKVSLLQPEPLDTLFPVVQQTGTAVVAREALAQSFLTDSFTADGPFDAQDFKSRLPREHIEKMLARAGQFKFLADEAPEIQTLPEAALNWVVSYAEVSTVIPGAKNVAELEQCLRVADAPPQADTLFGEETLQRVRQIQKSWED